MANIKIVFKNEHRLLTLLHEIDEKKVVYLFAKALIPRLKMYKKTSLSHVVVVMGHMAACLNSQEPSSLTHIPLPPVSFSPRVGKDLV